MSGLNILADLGLDKKPEKKESASSILSDLGILSTKEDTTSNSRNKKSELRPVGRSSSRLSSLSSKQPSHTETASDILNDLGLTGSSNNNSKPSIDRQISHEAMDVLETLGLTSETSKPNALDRQATSEANDVLESLGIGSSKQKNRSIDNNDNTFDPFDFNKKSKNNNNDISSSDKQFMSRLKGHYKHTVSTSEFKRKLYEPGQSTNLFLFSDGTFSMYITLCYGKSTDDRESTLWNSFIGNETKLYPITGEWTANSNNEAITLSYTLMDIKNNSNDMYNNVRDELNEKILSIGRKGELLGLTTFYYPYIRDMHLKTPRELNKLKYVAASIAVVPNIIGNTLTERELVKKAIGTWKIEKVIPGIDRYGKEHIVHTSMEIKDDNTFSSRQDVHIIYPINDNDNDSYRGSRSSSRHSSRNNKDNDIYHIINTISCEGLWTCDVDTECINFAYSDIKLDDTKLISPRTSNNNDARLNIRIPNVKERSKERKGIFNMNDGCYLPILTVDLSNYIDNNKNNIDIDNENLEYSFTHEFFTVLSSHELVNYGLVADKRKQAKESSKWFTPQQLRNFKRRFDVYDRNDSGTISSKDIWSLLKDIGENPSAQEMMQIIKNANVDNNNHIDFIEFQNIMAKLAKKENISKKRLNDASNFLSDKEIRQFKKAFNTYDVSGEGLISVHDLGTVLRSLDQRPTRDELNDIIAKADENGNGMIDFPAFLNAVGNKNKDDNKRNYKIDNVSKFLTKTQITKFRKAFDLYDINGDGSISSNQLEAVMKSLGEHPTRNEIREIISTTDIDGRGHITITDFLSIMANRTGNKDESRIDIASQWLTKQQINQIRRVFDDYDKYGNGDVNISKLKDMMKELGERISASELRDMIDNIDKNDTGKIEYSEFLYAIGLRWKDENIRKNKTSEVHDLSSDQIRLIKKKFNYYDVDRIGKILKKEFHSFLSDIGEDMTSLEIVDILSEFGLSKTNTLSYSDILQIMSYIYRKENKFASKENDLSNNDMLTREERKRIRNAFSEYDTNESDSISSRHLNAVLRELGEVTNTEGIRELVNELDDKMTGQITLQSLYTYLNKIWHGDKRDKSGKMLSDKQIEKYKRLFYSYDRMRSNYIRTSDLRDLFIDLGEKCTQREAANMVDEYDKDGSGRISYNNFLNLMSKKHEEEANKSILELTSGLTAGERKKLRDIFEKYDNDGRERINSRDLASALRKLGLKPSPSSIISITDRYESGFLSYTDYLTISSDLLKKELRNNIGQYMPKRIPGLTEKKMRKVRKIFDIYDKRGTGYVQTTSLDDICRDLRIEINSNEIRTMVHELDPDRTGRARFKDFLESIGDHVKNINREKIKDAMKWLTETEEQRLHSLFEEYDEDNLGVITAKGLYNIFKSFDDPLSMREASTIIYNNNDDMDETIDYPQVLSVVSDRWKMDRKLIIGLHDNNNNELTSDEIIRIKKAFRFYDKNNSGSISTTELSDALRDLGANVTVRETREILRKHDDDNSGTLKLPEFLEVVKEQWEISKLNKRVEELPINELNEIKKAFRYYDKDRSNSINARELSKAMNDLGHELSHTQIKELLNTFDITNDGDLSMKEFIDVVTRYRSNNKNHESEKKKNRSGLSQDEEDQIRKIFGKYDKRNSGKMSTDFLSRALDEVDCGVSSIKLKELINKYDTDGSNQLYYSDFLAIVKSIKNTTPLSKTAQLLSRNQIDRITKCFRHYDKDNTESISVSELSVAFRDLGQDLTRAQIKDIVESSDYDGNRTLNCNEFINVIALQWLPFAALGFNDDQARQVVEAFRKYDERESNFIKTNNLSKLLAKISITLSKNEVKDIISRYDKKNTKNINLQQFIEIVAEYWKPGKMQDACDGLSESEISRYKKAFEYYDKNNSGSITLYELQSALKDLGEDVNENECQAILNRYDTTNKSKLDMPQFIQLMKIRLGRNRTSKYAEELSTSDLDRIKKAFHHYDNDYSNTISVGELRSVMEDLGEELSRYEVKQLLDKHDKNASGNLTEKEFINIIAERWALAKLSKASSGLTNEQVERIRITFKHYDRNHDNNISTRELSKLLNELGEDVSTRKVKSLVAKYDQNNTGTLDFPEFLAVMREFWAPDAADVNDLSDSDLHKIKKAFKHYDMDNSGSISTSELRDALKDIGESLSMREVRSIISDYDPHGTGHIQEDNFIQIVSNIWKRLGEERRANKLEKASHNLTTSELARIRKTFDLYDKDHSGSISTSELRLALSDLGEDMSTNQVRRLIEEYVQGAHQLNFAEFVEIIGSRWKMVEDEKNKLEVISEGLTKGQVAHLRKVFDLYDRNYSGSISTKELKSILRELGETVSSMELERLVDEMDIDKSGNIVFSEFLDMMSRRTKARNKALLLRASAGLTDEQVNDIKKEFDRYDLDESGSISTKEIRRVFDHLGQKLSSEELRNFVDEVDKNGNGVVDFPEFLSGASKRIKKSNHSRMGKARSGLTKDQIIEIKQVFRAYDKTDSGNISFKELPSLMRELGEDLTPSDLRSLFVDYDHDNNGYLDLVEFMEIMSKRWKKDKFKKASSNLTDEQINKLRTLFNKYDTSGDGIISSTELYKAVRESGMNPIEAEEYVNSALHEIDSDRLELADFLMIAGKSYKEENIERSAISRASVGLTKEQVHIFRRVFDKHDHSKNGRVSTLEFEDMVRELGEKPSKDTVRKFIVDIDDETGEFTFAHFLRFMSDRWSNNSESFNHLQKAKNTGLTPDQVKKISKVFNNYDDDRTGRILNKYLGDILQELGEVISRKELTNIISNTDFISSRHFNIDELYNIMSKRWSERNIDENIKKASRGLTMVQAAKIRRIFHKHDKDHSGSININELKEVLKDLNESHDSRSVNNVLNSLNLSKREEIKLDDFIVYFGKKWKKDNKLRDSSRYLTKEQMIEFRNAFEKIDRDNSGFLDRDELERVFIDNLDYSDREASVIIRKMLDSSNGSNRVSFNIFLDVLGSKYKETNRKKIAEERIQEASMWLTHEQIDRFRREFNKYDKDKNGTIDVKELYRLMIGLGQSKIEAKESVEEIMSNMDQDNSGSIDFAEFLNAMGEGIKEENQNMDILQSDDDNANEYDDVLRNLRYLLRSRVNEVFLFINNEDEYNKYDDEKRMDKYGFTSENHIQKTIKHYSNDTELSMLLFELQVLANKYDNISSSISNSPPEYLSNFIKSAQDEANKFDTAFNEASNLIWKHFQGTRDAVIGDTDEDKDEIFLDEKANHDLMIELHNIEVIDNDEKKNFLKASLSRSDLPEILRLLLPKLTRSFLRTKKLHSKNQLGVDPWLLVFGSIGLNAYKFLSYYYKTGLRYSKSRASWDKQGIIKLMKQVNNNNKYSKYMGKKLFHEIDTNSSGNIGRFEYFSWWRQKLTSFEKEEESSALSTNEFIFDLAKDYYIINMVHNYRSSAGHDDSNDDSNDSNDSDSDMIAKNMIKTSKDKKEGNIHIMITIPTKPTQSSKEKIYQTFEEYILNKFPNGKVTINDHHDKGSSWTITVVSYKGEMINEKVYKKKHNDAIDFQVPTILYTSIIHTIYPDYKPSINVKEMREFMNELIFTIQKNGDINEQYNNKQTPYPNPKEIKALCDEYNFKNLDDVKLSQDYYIDNDEYVSARAFELSAYFNLRDVDGEWLAQERECDTLIYCVMDELKPERVMDDVVNKIFIEFGDHKPIKNKHSYSDSDNDNNESEPELNRKSVISFFKKCSDFNIISKAKAKHLATDYVTMNKNQVAAFISDYHTQFCRAIRAKVLKKTAHFGVKPILILCALFSKRSYQYIKHIFHLGAGEGKAKVWHLRTLVDNYKKVNGNTIGTQLGHLVFDLLTNNNDTKKTITELDYYQFWRSIIKNNYNSGNIYRVSRDTCLYHLIMPYPKNTDVCLNTNYTYNDDDELEWSGDERDLMRDSGSDDDEDDYHNNRDEILRATKGNERHHNPSSLSKKELEACRSLFDQFSKRIDDVWCIKLTDTKVMLNQLGFTYNSDFVHILTTECVKNLCADHWGEMKNIDTDIMVYEDFIKFMHIFFNLHDAVVHHIDEVFFNLFHTEANHKHVSQLMYFVNINDDLILEFHEMDDVLLECAGVNIKNKKDVKKWRKKITDMSSNNNNKHHHSSSDDDSESEYSTSVSEESINNRNLFGSRKKNHNNNNDNDSSKDDFPIDSPKQHSKYHHKKKKNHNVNETEPLEQGYELQDAYEEELPIMNPTNPIFSPHHEKAIRYSHKKKSKYKHKKKRHHTSDSNNNQAIDEYAMERLAVLDEEDNEYLKECWDAFLKYFDTDHSLTISINELGKALRTMGLDPSENKIKELFARADTDGDGQISFGEFKLYYRDMFLTYLKTGLNLESMREIFMQFDEDGDGSVTVDEFSFALKKMCRSSLSDEDITEFVRLVDSNDDNEIQPEEFIDIIRMVAYEGVRNELQPKSKKRDIKFQVGFALVRKIIRGLMPNPIEQMLAFNSMPPGFVPPSLNKLSKGKYHRLSYLLNPKLNPSGLTYDDFSLNERMLQAVPPPNDTVYANTYTKSQIGGHDNMNKNGGTKFPVFKESSIYNVYHIQLNTASNIPTPSNHSRDLIVARKVRVCLYDADNDKPISNIFEVKADWNASEEDIWNFELKDRTKGYEHRNFLAKSNRSSCYMILELTILVRKSNIDPYSNTIDADADFIEMSCGFTTLELSELDTEIQTKGKLEIKLNVHGGTPNSRMDIEEKDITARREGWKAVKQWFSTSEITPSLSLTISKEPMISMLKTGYKEKLSCLQTLPFNIICAFHEIRVIHSIREVIAEYVLFAEQPLSVGKIDGLPLNIFFKICDQQDAFQVLCELWDRDWPVTKSVPTSMFRNISSDELDDFYTARRATFKETVKSVWSALICSSNILPPLVNGVTDSTRLQMIRTLCMQSIPVKTLTSDGIGRLGMKKDYRTNNNNNNNTDVHFSESLVFAPFHTDEVAYDHAAHSNEVYRQLQWTRAQEKET